jgi:hypothetical protein
MLHMDDMQGDGFNNPEELEETEPKDLEDGEDMGEEEEVEEEDGFGEDETTE